MLSNFHQNQGKLGSMSDAKVAIRAPKTDDDADRSGMKQEFTLRLPQDTAELAQDEEWVLVESGGRTAKIRIHDYAEVYRIPGLYEALVQDALKCRSPQRVTQLLRIVFDDAAEDPRGLCVLDLGAGNGLVGERLREMGVGQIVGLDLLPEAKRAAQRDRPTVYDDYYVADLCAPQYEQDRALVDYGFNALVVVGALGFSEIQPAAFARALGYLRKGGWLAISIKEEFLGGDDVTGFAHLIRRLVDAGTLEPVAYQHYRHRISMAGEDLFYVALVARKRRELSAGEAASATLATGARPERERTARSAGPSIPGIHY